MLVLVSFVLVLAAAVTLVVGLLQSGLTLIYLSIACSVLAGVVLAVAVLRGRPEPKAAAGRSFTPPARPASVPASVGAPSSGAETTTAWNAPSSAPSTPPPSAPPPSARTPAPAPGDDAATKAAGSALLGRLRGRRAEPEPTAPAEVPAPPAPEPVPAPVAVSDTTEMATAAVPATPTVTADDDGFPVADYDRLRATELLARLPLLDRNQLEAVREREASGKNRFTVMNRIDALLAAKEEPAWEVDEDDWEPGVGTDAESEAVRIEADALQMEEDFGSALDEEELEAAGELEDDEVDVMVSRAEDFPIAGYDTLTVGQILPRLGALDADELAQVRAREQQGRARGTILDRIDRLATRSGAGAGGGAMAMPPASPAPTPVRKATPARKAATRKAAATKAAATSKSPAPAVRKASGRTARVPAAPAAPAAAAPVAPAKKAPAKRAAAAKVAPAPRKASTRKVVAPVVPAEPPVKKAGATKRPSKKI